MQGTDFWPEMSKCLLCSYSIGLCRSWPFPSITVTATHVSLSRRHCTPGELPVRWHVDKPRGNNLLNEDQTAISCCPRCLSITSQWKLTTARRNGLRSSEKESTGWYIFLWDAKYCLHNIGCKCKWTRCHPYTTVQVCLKHIQQTSLASVEECATRNKDADQSVV